MSAPWPRHSLWKQHVRGCLGYHGGWKILIPGVVVMGKVFTGEFSFLPGVKVHTFWGKIFPPRWVMERVDFSLAVGGILIPW